MIISSLRLRLRVDLRLHRALLRKHVLEVRRRTVELEWLEYRLARLRGRAGRVRTRALWLRCVHHHRGLRGWQRRRLGGVGLPRVRLLLLLVCRRNGAGIRVRLRRLGRNAGVVRERVCGKWVKRRRYDLRHCEESVRGRVRRGMRRRVGLRSWRNEWSGERP